jgi:ribosomal protein S26
VFTARSYSRIAQKKDEQLYPCGLRLALSTLPYPCVPNLKENGMARKTILVCDNCGNEVPESRGAVMRLNYTDARRGSKQADLCDDCAAGMPGQAVARRGRRPKAAAA